MSSHHTIEFNSLTSLPNLIPSPKYLNDINEQQNPVFEVISPLTPVHRRRIKIKTSLDIIIFLILLATGLGLFATVSENILLNSFAFAFLIAGIILVILTMWLVLTGASMFRKMNILKMVVSLIILSIGIILLTVAKEQRSLITPTTGFAVFSTALLMIITKFFFLAEDEQIRIQRLERELRKVKQSAGMGMALSYFYNFIVPTAANIRSMNEGPTPIEMEIARGNLEEYQFKNDKLFVIVPRDLDGSDMKTFLRNLSSLPNASIIQGKPKERPGNATHRPMFVYFLEWNTENKECNGLFDIPTIISSCWDRYINEQEQHHQGTILVSDEITIFQNQLISLINEHPITRGKVRILSFPSLPFQFADIKYVITRLSQ